MSPTAKRKRNEITANSTKCTVFNATDNHPSTTYTLPPTTPFYIDLGDCSCICEYCGARFWYDERCRQTSVNGHVKYKQCCKEGKVQIPSPGTYNPTIINLFTKNEFLTHIRAYNSLFSMTSFGAKVDDSINDGSGPYVFRVEGQICHWIGTLCPPKDEKPRFLQMYIYDTENEITHRLEVFNNSNGPQLSVDFVSLISKELATSNKLVKLFHSARDLIRLYNVPNFCIRLYSSSHAQSYDKPSDNCIGAIVTDSDPLADGFDIVIRNKEKGPQRINKLHPLYMSLQYPLLFIYGESGWSPDMRLTVPTQCKDRKLTMNMFYSYQLHDRFNLYSLLLRGGRLFQQYLVDAYVCMEQDRLDYYRYNQNTFRTEYLQGIHDAVSRGDTEGREIGKRIVLPTSFIGGPRYMYKHYQDALAICRVHGNPQYFVTFTCNVKWPEIEGHMAQFAPLKAQDRPDIIARVFQLKLKSLINFIKTENLFGEIEADLYTIEFQKRGLPYCHMLLWVASSHRIKDAEDIDKYISAEIPDRMLQPDLYRIVSDSMMHGPCGLARTNSPCMKLGHCSKKFPKNFEQTTCFDKNGYARYRRRSTSATVVKNGVPLDNRFVVPYNPLLCLYFEAHINVEYCGWSMLIKYLFKYISKGPDRIRYSINRTPAITTDTTTNTNPIQIDEIKNFVDSRFICPHEAAWRILNFHIHEKKTPVQMLAVHLENMQSVRFRDKDKIQNVANNPYAAKTTLTEWLLSNRYDGRGRHLRYIDYTSKFRWDASSKCWIHRSFRKNAAIGRLIYVHPTCGQLFYLRMLLTHQRGCKTFEDIRTVSGEVCPTYRDACEKLGLLQDDDEWSAAFNEAALWASASELRALFTHMLLYCEVSNPNELWKAHWRKMTDDIARIHEVINQEDLQQYVLYELELLLRSATPSSSLPEFGLPLPNQQLLLSLRNKLLMEERNYDRQILAAEHASLKYQLNNEQRQIHDFITSTIESNKQALAFVYGHGGTGKTFLWTTIISGLRSDGKIVLAVAASGIVSLLLPSGRTAHSRFKIPLDLTDDSTCNIKKNTHLAQLLTETSLIIWDEAPMSDRKCFESLDRTLKDLHDDDRPFGGKSILLGGDFRQTLPVKRKVSKQAILASSLPRSYLWSKFQVFKLTENMRLQRPGLDPQQKEEISNFSSWLLAIGNGEFGTPDKTDPQNTKVIEIPPTYTIPFHTKALNDLIHFIYDHETLRNPSATTLCAKAIVCPKNETAEEINAKVLEMAPGIGKVYLSLDTIVPYTGDHGDTEILYPTEYLNLLTFNGLPPHRLVPKINTPIMLLRNLNQTEGLCNGTRLIVTQLLPRVIEAQIMTGTTIGHRVYIPRITLTHSDTELPFILKRKQFPIKLCYAMTINKSQGQSLNKIGIYLPHPVFSHGQLYVALSRATSPSALKSMVRLSEIKPHEPGNEIRVRIIRKWKPHNRKEDLCYLLVDIHGDAIEASAKSANERYFDSKLKLNSCYAISDYLPIDARKSMQVVDHAATIRLGESTTFLPIEDQTIPTYYYRFVPYDKLPERRNNHTLLTDYIGRIERVSGVLTRKEKNLRKVMILDVSNNLIEITLWMEKINEVSDNRSIGNILAVTSTIVTYFNDNYQLESTSATTTAINPPLPDLPYYINRFKELDRTSNPTVTLEALLSKRQEDNMQHQGVCEATITTIDSSRPWFYVTCNKCNGRAYLQKTNRYYYTCEDHKEKEGFKYMYCVNATIADSTSSTKAVFYTEAMTDLTNITCEDLVINHNHFDPKILPDEISTITGTTCLLHLTLQKTGSISVNKVEKETRMTPNTPDPKMIGRKRGTQELPGQQGATKKTKA